jgi:hypothetical protein
LVSRPFVLEHDSLRVEVDAEAGAEIQFVGAPGGDNVLASYSWAAPIPVSRSASYGTSELDWLSGYRGRWQELFPNAGDSCTVDGVPLPFHGEVSASRWDVLHAGRDSLSLECAARLPLVVRRDMRLLPDAPVLVLEEVARNEGTNEARFIWGHHPAFDARPGMFIDLPAGPLHDADGTPKGSWQAGVTVPEGPHSSLMYLPDRPEGWCALRDVATGTGVALAWDLATFPHVWLWHEIGGSGFPWYGRARIVAIEPHAAWPRDGLAQASARGAALALAPGETRRAWLTLALFAASERPVALVERSGRVRFAD